MCNKACIDFGRAHLKKEDVLGRSVIEVGSLDVNGSIRKVVEPLGPASYIGVDIQEGPGVDRVCKVEDLINVFGLGRFDIVICTELLEHVPDWAYAVHNLKQIMKPGGMLLITTRSLGCTYHGYPFDFWRYGSSDMQRIFSDLTIEINAKDPEQPGVFLLARKGPDFRENDLHGHKLYSIVVNEAATIRKNRIYWTIIYLPLYIISRRPSASLKITAMIASIVKAVFRV